MKKWKTPILTPDPADQAKFAEAMKALNDNMDLLDQYTGADGEIPAYGVVSSGDDFCIQLYVKRDSVDDLKDVIPDKFGEFDVYYVEAEDYFKRTDDNE